MPTLEPIPRLKESSADGFEAARSGKAPVLLRWSSIPLVGASWISAGVFGLYILAFYMGALSRGQMERWNDNLSGLYAHGHPMAVAVMAAHLVAGAIILVLGPVQLMGGLRRRWPGVHRWLGRIYIVTALIAGAGGLGFIVARGTIGGAWMNVGFGLYGALMVVCAEESYRHARGGRFERHRAWSLRLFALAIGSWLYRMDYGFWLLAAHGIGHLETFRGPFDAIMAFFFYLPNLLVVEFFLRARRMPSHRGVRWAAAGMLNVATLVVVIGSYYFIRLYWGPAIVHALGG